MVAVRDSSTGYVQDGFRTRLCWTDIYIKSVGKLLPISNPPFINIVTAFSSDENGTLECDGT